MSERTIFSDLSLDTQFLVHCRLLRLSRRNAMLSSPQDFAPAIRYSLVVQRLACYIAGIPCPDLGADWIKPNQRVTAQEAQR